MRLIRGSREEHGRKTYLYCRFAIKKRFDYTFQAPDENEKVVYDFSLHRNPVFLIFAVGISKNSKENFATIDGNSLSNPFGRGSRIVIQLIPLHTIQGMLITMVQDGTLQITEQRLGSSSMYVIIL